MAGTEWTQVVPSDLIEVVVRGLEAAGEDPAEVLRYLGGVRESLPRESWRQELDAAIKTYLHQNAEGVGICPTCGRELEEVEYLQPHPGGTEHRRETFCPYCEWVELEAARRVAMRKKASA